MRPSPESPPRPCPARRRFRGRRGFTLVEAAIVTVIVGVGVTAMLELLAAGTIHNIESSELTTAVNLAKNVREMTMDTPFTNLTTYNGASYNPPRDGRGQTLNDLAGWQQTVAVRAVDPNCVTANISDATPDALRVTVQVRHNQRQLAELSWYCFKAEP